MNSGQSLPSPSRNTTILLFGEMARTPAAHARPYPGVGSATTRAPALPAHSAVRSVLPLSTTIISLGNPVARHARTTSAIGSSSFSAGITTDTSAGFITARGRRGEIKREREKISHGQSDGAGSNFRIKLQSMQKRRDAESKQASHEKRDSDTSADDKRAVRIAAPEPDDRGHDSPQARPRNKAVTAFPPQVMQKPTARQALQARSAWMVASSIAC